MTATRGIYREGHVRKVLVLERSVEVLHGDVPATIDVHELGVRYSVDPWHGQKTGLFLDQRENREAAARYAHGRLLDCFSYNGGFGLALAAKCASVEALDVSADAVARIAENAAANGITNLTAREANVFDARPREERAPTFCITNHHAKLGESQARFLEPERLPHRVVDVHR